MYQLGRPSFLVLATLGLVLPSCRNTGVEGVNSAERVARGSGQPASADDSHEARVGGYPPALREWRRKALLDEKGAIAPGAPARARAHVEALRQTQGPAVTGFAQDNWRPGPSNLAGRMRALDIDPRDANIMIAGAASGGIWRSTDGGTSWVPVGDMLPSLSISDIVRSSRTPDTLVASTGELFLELGPGGIPFGGSGEAIQGAGIYRSTDNGLTWVLVSPTPAEAFHLAIAGPVPVATADVILATTVAGIFRSTDLGTTWTNVRAGNMDVSFDPNDNTRVVAGGTRINGLASVSVQPLPCTTIQVPFVDAFLHVSSDAGLTWSLSSAIRYAQPMPAQIGLLRCPPVNTPLFFEAAPTRWEVEYHNNGVVYAVNDLGQVYRSINNGTSWTRTGTTAVGPQAFYDLALWVDRSDTDFIVGNDVVVVGGVTLRRSVNGGATFTQISNDLVAGSAHDDHHRVIEHPGLLTGLNRTVFAVTDGGIFRADNINTVTIGTWVARNAGLATTQFYGASTHPVTRRTVGGTQDQGGLRTEDFAPFSEITEAATGGTLGDAGFSAIDPVDPTFAYVTGTNLEVFQSTDGGLTVNQVGPVNGADFPNFFAPMILHPDDRDRLYIGGQNLYRTTNPRAATPTWTIVKTPVTGFNPIAAIAASQPTANDPDVIWVAHNTISGTGSRVFFTTTGGGTAPGSWTEDNAFPRPNRLPMRITIDPDDSMHVFVVLGGFAADNLWERTPAGTWQMINTPVAAPIRDFELDRADPNCFILATQVGLFVSPDRGATWQIVSPANVSIEETFWSRGHLFLATHGRGLFSQTPYASASAQTVGISCNIGGAPTPGPQLTSALPELGLSVAVTIGAGTPGALAFLTFGDPPASPPPPCGAQSINSFTVGSVVVSGAGEGTFSVALPDDPIFAGQVFVIQAAEFTASTINLSNGVRWTVGY